jgi:catechol 2,3-dioxygenase-like lactoylglutathione lyase family enzyme
MNRFHVHLNVSDLGASVAYYRELFGAPPTVLKPDYAKWMLDDPRVNFAISNTGRAPGVDHLGIQAESAGELAALGARLDQAGAVAVPEPGAICCYARSDKIWSEDPQGTRWETFHTQGEATTYYASGAACATDGETCSPDPARLSQAAPVAAKGACCAPKSGCC